VKESRSTEFLSGKKIAGHEAPVSGVYKQAQKRVIVFRDGSTHEMDLKQLKKTFDATLQKHQRAEMEQTKIRKPDGQTSIKIGGKEKGERKNYKTESAANAALTRAYGKH
jgi:hypothetical protein